MNALDLINYQTQLANTAHQREVADLKAAGLNPVLSAHGSGAETPNIMQAVDSGSGSSGTSAKSILAMQKASPVYQSLQTAQDAINTVNNIASRLMYRDDTLAANFANIPTSRYRPSSDEVNTLHNLGTNYMSYGFGDFLRDTGQSAMQIFGSYTPKRLASGNFRISDLSAITSSANQNFNRYAESHPKKAAVLRVLFPSPITSR